MNIRKAIILNWVIAAAALAYIVMSGLLWYDQTVQKKCTKVSVSITDGSPYRFVNDSIVRQWITESSTQLTGVGIDKIDVGKIESSLRSHQFIDSVEAYTTFNGELHIQISQCIPLVRVMSDTGYDFYIDSSLKILPMQPHFRADIPIISGSSVFGFKSDYYGELDNNNNNDKKYLKNIINFVGYISGDDFLQNLIVQIYINSSGEIELIPRIGEQVVFFGNLDDYQQKLHKLKKFYQGSFSQEWWLTKKIVNLKYKNQVIVS